MMDPLNGAIGRLRGGTSGDLFMPWRAYTRLCVRQPLLANGITMAAIAMAGDSLMQVVEGNSEFDVERTARFTLFRVAFSAPFYTMWYALLAAAVPATLHPGSAALIKTALDNLVATPAQHVAFFSSQAAWDGESAWARVTSTLPRSLPASWAFWGPTQLVTFGVVPAHLRVLFVNMVSLSWNAVMSGLNQQSKAGHHA